MGKLHIIDRAGAQHVLEGIKGWQVMQVLRVNNLGVDGFCDGLCSCATCQVDVDPDWIEHLPVAKATELDKLEELPTINETTRLSCQLIWSDELEGLKLKLVKV